MPTHPAPTPAAERLEVTLLGQRQFRAMNTTVELFTRDLEDTAALAPAEDLFHEMEARLSRFIPDSELCRLNDRSGEEVPASDVMFDILEEAGKLHRATRGAFDPAVLPDLEAAGYDRSFEKVARTSDEAAGGVRADRRSISELRIDRARGVVRGPAGLRIDLGGLGKGFTVDLVTRLLDPIQNFVVNAGGDIFARGCGSDGDGWLVAVTDPIVAGRTISLVRLYDEALATSTTTARRWRRAGELQHHLIDPRTGRPATSGVLSATVIARTAVEADVFAKTALLLGPNEGVRFLQEHGAHGLLITEDGQLLQTASWPGTPFG
jgi:thiamine biosynthesis lipoprotein